MGVSLCPFLAQSVAEPQCSRKFMRRQANRLQADMGPLGQAASQANGRNVTYLLRPISPSDMRALERNPGEQCIPPGTNSGWSSCD